MAAGCNTLKHVQHRVGDMVVFFMDRFVICGVVSQGKQWETEASPVLGKGSPSIPDS